jgi:RimJ/RimL family protein N-acetyltransferase
MIGQVILRRATGHGPPAAAGKAELGYLFLPEAQGFGYAAEAWHSAGSPASFPASRWCSLPRPPNLRSMRLAAKVGFTEAGRYEAYGAEQWFGMWSPVTPSD